MSYTDLQVRFSAPPFPCHPISPKGIRESRAKNTYISIAQASLAELETQLEIARRLNYISSAEHAEAQQRALSLGKQLYALRNALINRDARHKAAVSGN